MRPRLFDPSSPEEMDRPQPVNDRLRASLGNLCRLNRHFGGHRIIRWFLRNRLERGGRYTVLDLATGAGDVPRLVVDLARRAGAEVSIEAIDFQEATLEIAREWSDGYPEITFTAADVLRFDPGKRYDFVLCSLALHHFSEEDAVTILAKAGELADSGVLIADLERSNLSSACIRLVTATLYRDEMTRVDGRLSAERAFSFAEFAALAERAGWRDFDHRRFPLARQALSKGSAGS